MKEIEVEVKIKEIKKLDKDGRERIEIMIIRLRSEDQKREIMYKKKKLKGNMVWIDEDMTWKERKMKCA